MGKNLAMVRNNVLSPERSVSFSKRQYGVCFGKLCSNFFCPLGTEGFSSALLKWGTEPRDWRWPKRTLFAAEMLWFYVRLLSSHCLTFQCEEEYFRPLKASVNGEHWLQNIIGIAGTLIPHPSTPFYFQLFKIYQTLHLFT